MRGNNGDFGFHLGFRTDVINSVEQGNLYMSISPKQARRSGIEPPRPLCNILNQFIEEKIYAVVRDDSAEALRAASELREVLRSLVYGLKHPEFRKDLERLEAFLNQIGVTLRERLVIRAISAKQPEKIEEYRQMLNELAAKGCLTEAEFEEIVDRHCEALAAMKAS
jgi:hypothetical protein